MKKAGPFSDPALEDGRVVFFCKNCRYLPSRLVSLVITPIPPRYHAKANTALNAKIPIIVVSSIINTSLSTG